MLTICLYQQTLQALKQHGIFDQHLAKRMAHIMTSTSNNEQQTFTNEQIELSQVADDTELGISIRQINMLSLAPQYRRINIILALVMGSFFALLTFIASSGLFFDLQDDYLPIVIGTYATIIFFTTWSVIYHFLADPLKKYALREHDLNYQSGLIFRSFVSQPILRIQHIEIKRGPIERRAGMATLQVFSAGGVSYTFNIPGLLHEHAIKMRQFILDHKDLASDV